MSFIFK